MSSSYAEQAAARLSDRTYGTILGSVTVFTLIVQVYILYLVQYKSPKSMHEYRYFLNTFTIWDMIFTIILGTAVAPDTVPNTFGAWATGWSAHFSPTAQLFWLGAGFYSATLVIASQDYCLIYRFTVIFPDKRVHKIFMSKWSKVGWILFQQSIAIFLGVFSFYACIQEEEFPARLKLEPFDKQEAIKARGFFIWFDVEQTPRSLWFFGALIGSFIFSEVLCASLIFSIMKILRQNSDKFSKITYKLHRQFTILLAVQVITPIIFVLLPVTAAIVTDVVFEYYPDVLFVQCAFIWISLYALSNAIFTLFFISPYRSHFKGITKSVTSKIPQIRSSYVGSNQQQYVTSGIRAISNVSTASVAYDQPTRRQPIEMLN